MEYDNFTIQREYEGFKVGQYDEDTGAQYHKGQKCWINSYWVNVDGIDNDSILMSFYSKDAERVSSEYIYDIANDLSKVDYVKIIKSYGVSSFDVCWEDYIPPVSITWGSRSSVLSV